MKFDLISKLAVSVALAPLAAAITGNTAQVSTILDMQGSMGAALVIATGTLVDADATFTVLLEESDASDMSGANAVSDSDLNGTEALAGFTFAEDSKCRKLGYVGSKRYIRATITPATNTGAAPLSAIWLGMVEDAPAANPPG